MHGSHAMDGADSAFVFEGNWRDFARIALPNLLLTIVTLGIFWGFLEMFKVVPHVWAWWVLPAWAIALKLARLGQNARGS